MSCLLIFICIISQELKISAPKVHRPPEVQCELDLDFTAFVSELIVSEFKKSGKLREYEVIEGEFSSRMF